MSDKEIMKTEELAYDVSRTDDLSVLDIFL